jgi:hypothetical protein
VVEFQANAPIIERVGISVVVWLVNCQVYSSGLKVPASGVFNVEAAALTTAGAVKSRASSPRAGFKGSDAWLFRSCHRNVK